MKELHDKTVAGIPSDNLILDVRSTEEYAEGHVPGSRNIPYDEVQNHVAELGKFQRIFVHCLAGGRAQKACLVLEKQGLNNLVCVATSGMGDWIKAGYPIER